MKKTLLIGALLVMVVECAMYTPGPDPQTPEKAIADRTVAQIDSFSASISTQLLPAIQDPKTDLKELQQLFLQTRLAYKKFEWAAEYFTATTTQLVNGPPVPESNLAGFVVQPAGLQVIETCLYPKYEPGKRQEIIRQLRETLSNCAVYRSYYKGAKISAWQVWDACREEVFRIMTLGISGFDAPLAKSGLMESAVSLRRLGQVLGNYAIADNHLTSKFNQAARYLEGGSNFDDFNRAEFITAYANPLTAEILNAQQHLKLMPVYSRRLLRANAATLFDKDAFDASAFSAYPNDSLSTDKVSLGKKLFNDASLSGTGTRSCASCHNPALAFTDGVAKNTSLNNSGMLPRNTPTLLNAAFQPAQFADLRASTLEDQAHSVMESKQEMGGSIKSLAGKLSRDKDYSRLFAAAYPGTEKRGIGKKEITGALAAYIRTLSVINSRFDAYMRGDRLAMNIDEISGFNLFMGKAKCGTCHFMPLFNGALPPQYKMMDAETIGVPAVLNGTQIDGDRGRINITHATVDNHAFKTPSVRNATRTAPYMHNGVFTTLDEVVDFYDKGGGVGTGLKVSNQTLSSQPLKLSEKEKNDLMAFIKCLDNR